MGDKIVTVAVFSKTPIRTIDIESGDIWHTLRLTHVGIYTKHIKKTKGVFEGYLTQEWNEYRAPLNFALANGAHWRKKFDDHEYMVYFDENDQYGYFREENKRRLGYSVLEGRDLFVQFLGIGTWDPKHFYDWPDAFRQDVMHWLLLCERFGLRAIKKLMIPYIAVMY